MVAYVDDLLIVCKKKEAASIFENELRKSFILKDLGRVSEFVDVAIDYEDKKSMLTLSEVNAIGRFLKKFNMALCKAVSTPMEDNDSTLLEADADPSHDVPNRDVIGSSLYISICTRPITSYAILTLAQYCEAPTKLYRTMKKGQFRYLKGTQYTELVYRRGGAPDGLDSFFGYADADWAGLPCGNLKIWPALSYDNWLVS